ncbi:MAG: hypothetical protein ACR2P3_13935 [Geminicoccaceae bacterium]
MKTAATFLFTLTFVLGFGQDASAYIGPGAGLSMLGAFWGLVVAVVAALSFLLLWPIRKMFKKNAATPEVDSEEKAAP